MTLVSAMFEDIDPAQFWENSDYAQAEYVGRPVTDAMLEAVAGQLKYTLPKSYVTFLRWQNGGTPRLTRHRTAERTSWAHDHVAITGIYGIDSAKSCSLTGECGNQLWLEEWGYPDIGIYFADCPSAGHDMLCLDYRECGPAGEPKVVHIDQEWDYKITPVASSFEAFIRGLESDEAFEDSD